MSTLIISEKDKLNILRQYGILVEQEELLYPMYANKTIPIGPPPEFFNASDGKSIPFTDYKLSISDWIALVTNLFGVPGQVISTILEVMTAGHYYVKGDKYEAGLRVFFALLPFGVIIKQIPGVKKFTKDQLFDLLLSIKNKDKFNKEEIFGILTIINNLKFNQKTIRSYIYKFYLRIKIKSVISKISLNKFIVFVSENLAKDKNLKDQKTWKTISMYILKMLANIGFVYASWGLLYKAIETPKDRNYQKLKQNLEKSLQSFENDTIDDIVLLMSNLEDIGNLLQNKK